MVFNVLSKILKVLAWVIGAAIVVFVGFLLLIFVSMSFEA